MKLVSLNVWCGALNKKLIRFIKKESQSTDIFVFQEVTDWPKPQIFRPSKLLSAKRLYSTLKKTLPGFVPHKSVDYVPGFFLATFVRKSIDANKEKEARLVGPVETFGNKVISRLFCVEISVSGRNFWACNTHGVLIEGKWRKDTAERILQSKLILNTLKHLTGPKILCGDFNLEMKTKSLKLLERKLISLTKKYKVKNTRTRFFPLRRKEVIDQVFVSPELKVKNFKVLRNVVSDHLPLSLEFS
jgi:endonuclease/exonuclease/phosphatase family metal-dependent hydrolase